MNRWVHKKKLFDIFRVLWGKNLFQNISSKMICFWEYQLYNSFFHDVYTVFCCPRKSHLFTVLNKISDPTRVRHLNPQIDKLWMYCLVSVSSTGTYKAAAWFVRADRAGTTRTVNIQLPSASRNGCHPTKTWGMLCRILGIGVLWLRFLFWNMIPHHWVIGSWHLMTRQHITIGQKLWGTFFQSHSDHNLMFFWPCIMNWLYINYQLLCTDYYLFIKY